MILGMKPRLKRAALIAALALVVIGYALLLWRGPWWIDGDHLRTRDLQPADGVVITGIRTALVALGAGAIAALGLHYTHQTLKQTRLRDSEQAKSATEGQINDRYVEAVKLLAAEGSLTQRLGGIYALERNMHDSHRDHPTVVAILSAFIRSATPEPKSAVEPAASRIKQRGPEQDIQAALDVLGRQPADADVVGAGLEGAALQGASLAQANFQYARLNEVNLSYAEMQFIDLTHSELRRAKLRQAKLHGAKLRNSDLTHADLGNATLTGADLSNAQLSFAQLPATVLTGANLFQANLDDSNLRGAVLPRADLTGAYLSGADLSGAQLRGANLTDAELEETNLSNTNLRTAKFSSVEQLVGARIYKSTVLPSAWEDAPMLLERVRECEEEDAANEKPPPSASGQLPPVPAE